MSNPEQSRSSEQEINPEQEIEQVAEQVLEASTKAVAEKEKDKDPSWVKKHKEALIAAGVIGGVAVGGYFIPKKALLLSLAKFAVFSLVLFAKKLIEKKGKISFKDGYEIGEYVFSLGEEKKGKK